MNPLSGRLTLSARLIVVAIALCALGVGAVTLVVGFQASDRATESADQLATRAAQGVAGEVAGELGASFAAVDALAAAMEGMKTAGRPPSRDQLDDMARRQLQLRPEFIGAYSIWEPNALDGRDAEFVNSSPAYDETGRYIAYWNRGSGQIEVEALVDYETAGLNDWYDIPRRTRRSALIEPYVYPIAGKDVLMTTMVTPILVEGRFVAASGADLPLQALSDRLGRMEPVPGGRVRLLSNGGLYVSHQEVSRLAQRADDLPSQAMEKLRVGQPHRWEDGEGWIHLLAPVRVVESAAPWGVLVSYPAAVAAQAAREQLTMAALTGLLACVLAAVLLTVMLRRMLRPLKLLSATMDRLALGEADLKVELPVQGNDELSAIARGFNGFTAKLREAFRQVSEVSTGVATASQEIASGNSDLSSRTESQASHVQQSAASLRELTDAVTHSAETSDHAAQLARAAVDHARSGQQVMREARTAMDQINDSSRRIADITGLIDSIAFQTNILALNAAVEAARAGDQGRGFAVVAGEVRNLAQRSAEAAKDIRRLTDESVGSVAAGSGLIRQVESALDGLGESVQQVDQLLADISSVTREQASRIQSVTHAVGELDQNTQQNAAIVEQAAAAADALRQQSGRLVQTVRQFLN